MADYQSLLTRAVANLPKGHAPSARQTIYDRARKALVTQLRTLRPPLPENDITREEAALDRAIAAVEEGFGPIAAPAPEAPPPPANAPPPLTPPASRPEPPPPPAPRPAPVRPPVYAPPPSSAPSVSGAAAPAPRPAAPPPRPSTPANAAPQAPTYPVRPSAPAGPPPVRANSPAPPAGARPAPTIQVAPAAAGAAPAPAIGAARATASSAAAPANLAKVVPSAKGDPAGSNAPPIHAPTIFAPVGGGGAGGRDEGSQDAAFEGAAIGPAERGRGAPPTNGATAEGQRPSLPPPEAEKKRQTWLWPTLAVLVGIALSVAVAAILMRQKPQDLAISPPTEQQPAPEPVPAKSAERAEPPPAEAKNQAQPAQSPPPQQAAQQPPSPDTAQPAAAGEAPAQGQAQAPPQTAEQTLPTSARAALLIASPDNPQKPVVNLGSTVWSLIPAQPDKPSTIAVKADADIPDLKLHATMTLRKNTDPTLQATNTIDLKFTFAEGAPITGFKDVGLPQMRQLDSTASESLNSVRVKIGDDYFLIALAKSDVDTPRNLELMKTHAWFDFPLLLNDNRIAKLVFQKSAEGQQMLDKAFEAWK